MKQSEQDQLDQLVAVWLRGVEKGSEFYTVGYQLLKDSLPNDVSKEVQTSLLIAGKEYGYSLPTVDDFKADAKKQVQQRHAKLLRELTGDYSDEERDTFYMQLKWAEGYLKDSNTLHKALLSGMLSDTEVAGLEKSRSDPAEYMAKSIISKSAQAEKLISKANSIRREVDSAIDQSTSVDDLNALLGGMPEKVAVAIQELTDVQ